MIDAAAVRAALQERLKEFVGRAGNIGIDLDSPLSADSEEQAVEREDDAALEGQAILVDHEIAAVRAALERLDQGTYGACSQCGTTIAVARLAALPEAALCLACAAKVAHA